MTLAYNLIKQENINKIAEEIVDIFKTQASDQNVEYEFVLKKEDGKISNNMTNTFFYFDTTKGSVLDEFKKSLFSSDLENIEEGSKEEEELMNAVNDFLQKICKKITDEHKSELQEVIRRVVLGGKSEERNIPLNTIQILSIDIADFSSVPEPSKYLLKIKKELGTEINVDDITIFAQNKEEEGQSIPDTLIIEKQSGNPLFKNVISLEKGKKFLNEVSLYIYVDYSFEK